MKKIMHWFWSNYGCKWWGHKVITTYMPNLAKWPKHFTAKNGVIAFSVGLPSKKLRYLNSCPRCGTWSLDNIKGKITV